MLTGAETVLGDTFRVSDGCGKHRDDSVCDQKMNICDGRGTYKRQGHLRIAHSHDTESRSPPAASSDPLGDNMDEAGK